LLAGLPPCARRHPLPLDQILHPPLDVGSTSPHPLKSACTPSFSQVLTDELSPLHPLGDFLWGSFPRIKSSGLNLAATGVFFVGLRHSSLAISSPCTKLPLLLHRAVRRGLLPPSQTLPLSFLNPATSILSPLRSFFPSAARHSSEVETSLSPPSATFWSHDTLFPLIRRSIPRMTLMATCRIWQSTLVTPPPRPGPAQ